MDINNLMENVRSFFTEQYKGVDQSDLFIAFEPLGCMIDPSDFTDENNEVSEIKAREQLSLLGDRLPDINDVFLPGSGRLSTAYEMLIESAVYTGDAISAEDQTPYIARFGEVKAESLLKFEDGRKASITMPEGNYLPVYAHPEKWYDPTGSFWVRKSFSEQENVPAPTSKPISPAMVSVFSKWKTTLEIKPEVLSSAIDKTSTSPSVITPVKMFQTGATVKHGAAFSAALVNKPAFNSVHATLPVNGNLLQAKQVHVNPVLQAESATSLKPLRKLSFANRIKVLGELTKNNNESVAPVRANGFSMSFDYCLVYLDRPWLNTSIFSYSSLWCCLSLKEAYFSNGAKDDTNTGILKSIPSAMILLKNLRITAAWTDEDKTNAKNSVGLGVFNLNDSTFSNNELSIPGMQIIGWVCDVMPKLPAQGDKNLK